MRVILFDKNLITSSRIKSSLTSAGFEVVLGGDPSELKEGETLVALVNAESPGWEDFLRSIKDKNPEVKAIAFCGHTNRELQERAIRAGADAVVPNSVAVTDPVSALRHAG